MLIPTPTPRQYSYNTILKLKQIAQLKDVDHILQRYKGLLQSILHSYENKEDDRAQEIPTP